MQPYQLGLREFKPVPGSKVVGKVHRKKMHENHGEAGERQESGACHQCF